MNLIAKRKLWFGISSIIILIGLISMLLFGFNWGIDFTGGLILHYNIGKDFDISDVRQILNNFNLKDYEVKKAGDFKQEVIIRTQVLTDEEKAEIYNAIKEKWPSATLIRTEKVDPIIGEELRHQALIALTIASIGMLIYITIRFEFKFAVAAILAIIHDVLVVLSLFSLLKIPINSPFVAAMLTIVGYSINDTIVLFDRIRENIKLMKKSSLEFMVNTSILQTMARSINTSFTTLITITALFIFGGETIKDFALALIVGIISGTYSSIFIASPLWLCWKLKEKTSRA
ncbi:MAG: preprotein translocase subunit SecF [Thermosediminibacterales bacterium]|nr:preprotein translocase subunit SecF [Thermosediminibacterales bacterium]